MELILLEKVDKLGTVGDNVRVKDGYGRNYLLPRGLALRATEENKKIFEAKKAEIEKEIQDKKSAAETLSKKIRDMFVVLIRQAGEDGRLYGSVTTKDIAALIGDKGVEVSKSQVVLSQPIKYVGVHVVTVKLHSEVVVEVRVNVARTKDESEAAKKAFLNPAQEKKDEEGQGEDEPVAQEG